MARARRRVRRRVKRTSRGPLLALIVILGGSGYMFRHVLAWPFMGRATTSAKIAAVTPPALTTDRPETAPLDGGPFGDAPELGSDPLLASSPATPQSPGDAQKAEALLVSARRALADGDAVLARAHFTEAMEAGLPPKDELDARAELRKLGRQTILSATVAKGDPYTDYYTIAPGDTLVKIAKTHKVTADFLARINGIADMHMIRAGQRIKVVKGPFHARVTKSAHTLDVFCGNTFVNLFSVGLGAENGTPTGKWVVASKLKNPTYYPPRGGDIVAADDPRNPLGERWIGLDGVGGEALGQTRYGIHGTIEPDSIGKNASMGCIRMHNEDVEQLYEMLIEKESTVEVAE